MCDISLERKFFVGYDAEGGGGALTRGAWTLGGCCGMCDVSLERKFSVGYDGEENGER